MFGILRRHRRSQQQVEADVALLIAQFGDEAYYEARDRLLLARRGVVVDGNRSADHWKVNENVLTFPGRGMTELTQHVAL
jgi:hypothetical protein